MRPIRLGTSPVVPERERENRENTTGKSHPDRYATRKFGEFCFDVVANGGEIQSDTADRRLNISAAGRKLERKLRAPRTGAGEARP